jgi:urease gamma subunit
MRLTPREEERLLIFSAAELARRRLARGRRLNVPESIALICDEVLEKAWDGCSMEQARQHGQEVLSRQEVMVDVPAVVTHIEIEALFPSGTALVVVERPFGADEVVGGFGKTFREDALAPGRGTLSTLDLLISNVVVIDPMLGVRKTNIGIKDGVIVGAGSAGSRDVADNPDLLIGPHTGLIPGEGLIATPGAVDSHVHLSNTNVLPTLLACGVTTILAWARAESGTSASTPPTACRPCSRPGAASRSTWRCWVAAPATLPHWRLQCPSASRDSNCTRTSAQRQLRSTPPCGSPTPPMSLSPSTPTR